MNHSIGLLKKYLRLVIAESSPSKLKIREPYLSADSTGYEGKHLDRLPVDPEAREAEEEDLAPHLRDEVESLTSQTYGPVPPKGIDPHAYPDQYVRGQFDNVTWER